VRVGVSRWDFLPGFSRVHRAARLDSGLYPDTMYIGFRCKVAVTQRCKVAVGARCKVAVEKREIHSLQATVIRRFGTGGGLL
jgi:hypothetical protein